MRTFALVFLLSLAGFFAHEAAHGAAGAALGYEMAVSANHARADRPVSEDHELIIDAAGPVLTFVLGAAGYFWALKGSLAGFSLLFAGFMQRLLAAAVSFANPNDEARISEALGWGPWLLPCVVAGLLFAMTAHSTLSAKVGLGRIVLAWLAASAAISIVVLGEGFLPSYRIPAF